VRLACAMWVLRNEAFYKLFTLTHSLTHTHTQPQSSLARIPFLHLNKMTDFIQFGNGALRTSKDFPVRHYQ